MILRIADARSDEVVADVMDREAYDAYCCEMIVLSLSIVARVALALVLVRAAETALATIATRIRMIATEISSSVSVKAGREGERG